MEVDVEYNRPTKRTENRTVLARRPKPPSGIGGRLCARRASKRVSQAQISSPAPSVSVLLVSASVLQTRACDRTKLSLLLPTIPSYDFLPYYSSEQRKLRYTGSR